MASVKVKTLKIDDDDGNLSSVFNQLVGAEDADVTVIKPKYIKLRSKLVSAAKLLDAITIERVADVIPDQKAALIEINRFANDLITVSKIREVPDDKVPDDSTEINVLYKELKDNPKLRVMFLIVKDLRPYDQYLRDVINDKWIVDMPGYTFKIFSNFSEFDLKAVWMQETVHEKMREYLLKIIMKLYRISEEIAEIVTSPDVDPEAFTQVLQGQIAMLRKHIPRCDDAFDRIASSSDLLKSNFNGYYRGFVQSGDATSMIQSFVLDVSQKQKVSPKLTRQYHEIIKFYNKQTSSKPLPEKFRKVMERLNQTYSMVEQKHSEEQRKTEETKDPAEDSIALGKTEKSQARKDKEKRKKEKKKLKKKTQDEHSVEVQGEEIPKEELQSESQKDN